jgi:enediyne biosynthesis protein E3
MKQNTVLDKLNKDTTLPINIQAARGVPALPPNVQKRLRQIRATLIQGFQAAIVDDTLDSITPRLCGIADELRGFAFEGVGMGLTQRDLYSPNQKNRVDEFVIGFGAAYEHFVYVGVGLMLGKKPLPLEPYISQLNPAKVGFVLDGYGFQHGLSHWQKYLDVQAVPEGLSDYDLRVFDQGLGRCIWFADGTDVTCISKTIGAFSPMRQADLWGGIGFVCAYSGGVERSTLEALKIAAGSYQLQLSEGAAFAAKSRQQIGSHSLYTELACEVLWGMNAASVTQKDVVESSQSWNSAQSNQTMCPIWHHYRAYIDMPKRSALLA